MSNKKGEWTGAAVLFFYTTERARFTEAVPEEVKHEYSGVLPKMMKRHPQLYCSHAEEKYGFKFNPEWQLQHMKLLAKILNEHDVSITVMEEKKHGN